MLTLNVKTPASASVLGEHAIGWFGETGRHDLLQVANAPYKSNHSFEEMFECDPKAKHMGYKSWDGTCSLPQHQPRPCWITAGEEKSTRRE